MFLIFLPELSIKMLFLVSGVLKHWECMTDCKCPTFFENQASPSRIHTDSLVIWLDVFFDWFFELSLLQDAVAPSGFQKKIKLELQL